MRSSHRRDPADLTLQTPGSESLGQILRKTMKDFSSVFDDNLWFTPLEVSCGNLFALGSALDLHSSWVAGGHVVVRTQ